MRRWESPRRRRTSYHRHHNRSRSPTWRFDSPPRITSQTDLLLEDIDPKQAPLINIKYKIYSNASRADNNKEYIDGALSTVESSFDKSKLSVSETNLVAALLALPLSSKERLSTRQLVLIGLQQSTSSHDLLTFLNVSLQRIGCGGHYLPVKACWTADDGNIGIIQFHTIEDTNAAISALSNFDYKGKPIQMSRPAIYPRAYSGALNNNTNNTTSEVAKYAAVAAIQGLRPAAQQDRLILYGLPKQIDSEYMKDRIIDKFGKLRVFSHFCVNRKKPFAICILEFETTESSSKFKDYIERRGVEGLLGRDARNATLTTAAEALRNGALTEALREAETLGGDLVRAQVPTRVLMLSNVITPNDLQDIETYNEIVDDVRMECETVGGTVVLSLEIPKEPPSAIGLCFVEFATVEGAIQARRKLTGRQFAGRVVEGNYYSEKKMASKDFYDPKPNYEESHSSLHNKTLLPPPAVIAAAKARAAAVAAVTAALPPINQK